jgi:tRNA (mo5U34)-methyltransferase
MQPSLNASNPGLHRSAICRRIDELGPWFHNIDLEGVKTAPNHPLGDYPAMKWACFAGTIAEHIPGSSVLDIGCSSGFYSIEMKRRGAARVVGIDFDVDYLAQASFAAQMCGVEIELRHLSVYDVARLGERFDIVLFMGVLYHLRHPLLALDLINEHVAGDLVVFQSMLRGDTEINELHDDYGFWDRSQFDLSGYPRLHFVERRYAGDQTNWWVPNQACAEAMLRSAAFAIDAHP